MYIPEEEVAMGMFHDFFNKILFNFTLDCPPYPHLMIEDINRTNVNKSNIPLIDNSPRPTQKKYDNAPQSPRRYMWKG